MEEILHRLIGSLSHYLQGFIHYRWCRISSINSTTADMPILKHAAVCVDHLEKYHYCFPTAMVDDIQTYRRWTKYSNLEEKIGLTPPTPNVNVKQRVRDMSCCGV